jgi:hypothetical protein
MKNDAATTKAARSALKNLDRVFMSAVMIYCSFMTVFGMYLIRTIFLWQYAIISTTEYTIESAFIVCVGCVATFAIGMFGSIRDKCHDAYKDPHHS